MCCLSQKIVCAKLKITETNLSRVFQKLVQTIAGTIFLKYSQRLVSANLEIVKTVLLT